RSKSTSGFLFVRELRTTASPSLAGPGCRPARSPQLVCYAQASPRATATYRNTPGGSRAGKGNHNQDQQNFFRCMAHKGDATLSAGGQVEDPARAQFSLLDLGKRDQLALGRYRHEAAH